MSSKELGYVISKILLNTIERSASHLLIFTKMNKDTNPLHLYNYFTLSDSLFQYQHSFINKQNNILMADQIVLGYWAVRGRGQTLRHLLSYTGLSFTEKLYKTPDQYGKDFSQLGNFPNLPYLKDGDFIFSQTLGIARYIPKRAGRYDLLGKSAGDQAILDNFIYAFDELFTPIIGMFFNKKVNDIKIGHYYKIQSQLKKFQKFVKGKDYVLGYITIADFFIAQYSHYIEKLYPQQFSQYTGLKNIRNNIQNLPEVKQYYKRSVSVLTPFLPPTMTAFPFFWPGTQKVVPKAQTFVKKQQQTQKKNVNQKVQTKSQVVPQPIIIPQLQQNWDQQVQPHYPQVPHRVIIISGSLSGNSTINYFLSTITGISHPAFQFSWADISSLQLHNQDYQEAGTESVNNLRGQVYEAQAVLIGVHENHNVLSAALVNAFNWLVPVLKQKPVALVSMQSSEKQIRKGIEQEGIPCLASAKLSISDPGTFFNEEGGLSGPSLNRVVNFFNKFAIFLETGQ